jgi:hypothetical protein
MVIYHSMGDTMPNMPPYPNIKFTKPSGGGPAPKGIDIHHVGVGGGTRDPVTDLPLYNFEDHDIFNSSIMWGLHCYEVNVDPDNWYLYNLSVEYNHLCIANIIDPTTGLITHDKVDYQRDLGIMRDCGFTPTPFNVAMIAMHLMVKKVSFYYEYKDGYGLTDTIAIGFCDNYGGFTSITGNCIQAGAYFCAGQDVPGYAGNWMICVGGPAVRILKQTTVPIGGDPSQTGNAMTDPHKFHVKFGAKGAWFWIDDLFVGTINEDIDLTYWGSSPVGYQLFANCGCSTYVGALLHCRIDFEYPFICAGDFDPIMPVGPRPT